MRHPPAMRFRIPVLVLVLGLLAPAAPRAQGADPPFPTSESWRRNRSLIARFDQLDRAGRSAAAWGYLDSLVAAAEARGDRALLMQALIKRGGTRGYRGEPDRGEADLIAADRLGLALRDTLGMLEATRWRAFALAERGRSARSVRHWTRMRDLARAWGSPSHEGWARLGLALADLEGGRIEASRLGYRRAREAFQRAGDAGGLRQAGVGLQRVLMRQRRFDEVRELTLQLAREANAAGDRLTEAQLYNNLGALEWWLGDPRRSLDLLRRSLALFRENEQRTGRPMQPATFANLSRALVRLGREDEAAAQLESAIADWRPRDLDAWCELEVSLATVRLSQSRAGEAERRMRAVAARRDSARAGADEAVTAILMLALTQQDRHDEALALALRHRPRLAEPGADPTGELRTEVVRAFIRGGRAAEALALIGEVGADDRWERPERSDHTRALLRTAAMAEAGRLPEAAARLPLLRRQLLALRAAGRDYTSRESFGSEAEQLAALTARILADPALPLAAEARAAAMFDALQPLKAVTLDERLRAPGHPDSAGAANPVTLARLRAQVLRPGELLIDVHSAGPRTVLLAVSRREVRMTDLGPARALGARLARLQDLITGADRSAADEAAAALGRLLFADAADLVRANPVLLFSPGSQLVALAAARLPGAREPLGATHTVALVPSATVLARLRAQPERAGAPLVALAGGEDARGRRLAGARAEVRWLGTHFQPVRTPEAPTGERALRALRGAGIAHLAGHSELDEDNPWGSRLLLGESDRSGAWLEAASVARTRLPARLAVLSGCRSVGAARGGEGVLGLSSAFLSAGVPSTVASLWEVDDARAAETMRGFYRALAEGRTAGEALQRAQAELRGRAATSAPREWAAFTLVGLPETRVTLRRTLASRVLP